MSIAVSIWALIALAAVAANLPFANQRLFAVIPLRGEKIFAIRLAELVVLYVAVGGVGKFLENMAGQIQPQGWQFYAITSALFITLAFPGFVWRYLVRHRRR